MPATEQSPASLRNLRRRPLVGALAALWMAAGLLGWNSLFQHAFQPTPTAGMVTKWPVAAFPTEAPSGSRVVVFAHPCCPCTRATLCKLDETLTRLPKDVAIDVIFATAGLKPSDVSDSPTVAYARRLRGINLRFDETGDFVRRFRASVSGEVFAFDRHGRRVFHGGITAGRGHLGDSNGQQQLERLLRGHSPSPISVPVYGCSLPRSRTPASLPAPVHRT